MFWAFPHTIKATYRYRETLLLSCGVGLSTISFTLQKEGGQKDAVPIPNADGISEEKVNFSFLGR